MALPTRQARELVAARFLHRLVRDEADGENEESSGGNGSGFSAGQECVDLGQLGGNRWQGAEARVGWKTAEEEIGRNKRETRASGTLNWG
jgi:hypothetical protein